MTTNSLMTLPTRPFLQACEARLGQVEQQLGIDSLALAGSGETFTPSSQDPDLRAFGQILQRVSLEAVAAAVGGPVGLAYAAAQAWVAENPDPERWAALHQRNLTDNQLDLTDHPGKERLDRICSDALRAADLNPADYQIYTYRRRDGLPNLGNSLPGRIYVHHDLASSFSDAGLAFMVGHEVGHLKAGDSARSLGYNTFEALLQRAQEAECVPPGTAPMARFRSERFRDKKEEERQRDREGAAMVDRLGFAREDAFRDMGYFTMRAYQEDGTPLPQAREMLDGARAGFREHFSWGKALSQTEP